MQPYLTARLRLGNLALLIYVNSTNRCMRLVSYDDRVAHVERSSFAHTDNVPEGPLRPRIALVSRPLVARTLRPSEGKSRA